MTLRCDTIIRDATLFDGTGAPRRGGDVGIKASASSRVGRPGGLERDRDVIDARGRSSRPDSSTVHTHDDRAVLCGPGMHACKISQGVTTVVVGNCGISLAPLRLSQAAAAAAQPARRRRAGRLSDSFGRIRAAVDAERPAVNVAAPGRPSTLRVDAMDGRSRIAPATTSEIAAHARPAAPGAGGRRVRLLDRAFTIRTKAQATTDEVIAVAEAIARMAASTPRHMRDEGDRDARGARRDVRHRPRGRASRRISHHKCAGPANCGRTTQTLPLLVERRADAGRRARRLSLLAGSTVLRRDKLRRRHRDHDHLVRCRIRRWRGGGLPGHRPAIGTPTARTACDAPAAGGA